MSLIFTIVGARPQFIKAAPVSKAIRDAGHKEILVHTGQHYDYGMSQVFFEELEIPAPDFNLGIGSGAHGEQTGRMLADIERLILNAKPDWVLVYGDTNSTLAGALAAAKLNFPIAHVEAGLRSFNRRMPEEINRVMADHLSTLLFCPTEQAIRNLEREGITKGVLHVGDVMFDSAVYFGARAKEKSGILDRLKLAPGGYFLATVHRAENTDSSERLAQILVALNDLVDMVPVVFPMHPRTAKMIDKHGIRASISRLTVIDPVPFLDMVRLEQEARLILTDSGGVQKEAYFHKVPCLTLRDETEWVETVNAGWNQVVGASHDRILAAVRCASPGREIPDYGTGDAATEIARHLS